MMVESSGELNNPLPPHKKRLLAEKIAFSDPFFYPATNSNLSTLESFFAVKVQILL